MANACCNNIDIVSTEAGIRKVLLNMRENLVKTGWIEAGQDAGDESPESLERVVGKVVNFNPAYLDALSTSCSARPYEDAGSLSVRNVAPGVWSLSMSFVTAWGPIVDGSGSETLDPEETYLFEERWEVPALHESARQAYVFEDDNGGLPYKPEKVDKEHGSDWLAAAYCREFTDVEPFLTEERFRNLIKDNAAEKLALHMDDDRARNWARWENVTPIFKKGRYELFRVLVEMSGETLTPRSATTYLKTCCDEGLEDLALFVIGKTDWNASGAKKAKEALSSWGREDLAGKVDEAMQAAEEAERRRLELILERLRDSRNISPDGTLTLGKGFEGLLNRDVWIPDECFAGRDDITAVVIDGSSVMGKRAFAGCVNLKSVTVGYARFEAECFSGCSSLVDFKVASREDIQLPGSKTFHGCESLRKLRLPLNFYNLKANTLGALPNLEEVSVVAKKRGDCCIEKNAFAKCPSLKRVKVGKGVELGEGALSELGQDVIVEK